MNCCNSSNGSSILHLLVRNISQSRAWPHSSNTAPSNVRILFSTRLIDCPKRHYSLTPRLFLQHTTADTINGTTVGTGAKVPHVSNSLRPSSTRTPAWTRDEDQALYKYVQQGKSCHEIFLAFPGRTLNAINIRMSRVRNAKSVSMNEDGSVVSLTKAHREKDLSEGRQLVIMKKIWKEQGAQSKLEKLEREDEKEAFEKYERRNTLFQSTRKLRRWTEEESKLLIKLVHKYREEPGIWGLVAGGTIEDDDGNMQTLARMGMSCKRQWVYLNRPEQIKTGYWSADEKQKLVEAIRKRVGNGFEITIDVLRTPGTTTAAKANKAKREQDKSTATTASTANSTTAIGADALERGKQKLLKMGGPELSSLNWLDIAAEVGTRDGLQCRNHFYANMHNGRRGHWTEEERRLFKEAYKKYGNQWRAIATHVGTRSSAQAKYAYQTIMGKE